MLRFGSNDNPTDFTASAKRRALSSAEQTELTHVIGPADAPLTLVEYGTYGCSHCARTDNVVEHLLNSFGDQLKFIYRHFPRATPHSPSWLAAEAAETAGVAGLFWEMHRRLLHHDGPLDRAALKQVACYLPLDLDDFEHTLDSRRYQFLVEADFKSAVTYGVRNTPTFFINGQMHDDFWDFETLGTALKREQEWDRGLVCA